MQTSKYIDIQKIKRNERIAKFFTKIAELILIIGLSFIILFPIISSIIPAMTQFNYLGEPNSIWIPNKIDFFSFKIAAYLLNYWGSLGKTIIFALVMMVIQVTMSAIVGYGFSKLSFKGHNILFFFVILTIVVPPQAIMLPQFMLFKKLNLLNKVYSIFLLAFFGQGLKSGLFIFLFRQFFKELPQELEEAALIDGCGYVKTFYQIMLPNAGNLMLTIAIFSFVWNFSDLYYVNWFASDAGLLSSTLAQKFLTELNIVNAYQDFTLLSKDSMNPLFVGSVRGAGLILYVMPLLILYFIVQKRFVQGFERSGIVG